MWQEEYARVINFNVERECNRFIKKKILASQSEFQSKQIPIPEFAAMDSSAQNFMGRLARAFLVLTDARKTIYAPECNGWYRSSGQEVAGLSLFGLLNRCIGITGLCGLDRLMSFRVVHSLRSTFIDMKVCLFV